RFRCEYCVVVLLACGPLADIHEKPCQPGCVDETTRLVCEPNTTVRAVPCPVPNEICATSVCRQGVCELHPASGLACGRSGNGKCNEGFACLGPKTKLTALRRHTCLLAEDGKVWCWGDNNFGELGDGSTTNRSNPVLVQGLPSPAIDVSAGYNKTCAI